MMTVRFQSPLVSLLWSQVRGYVTKKSASSSKWLNRQKNDPLTRAAKFEQYKSRAAYKLKEIDDRYKLFKKGQSVVDLGFAPGAWTQVAVERTAPNGRILGVDIIPTRPPKGASALQANITSKQTHVLIQKFFIEHHGDPDSETDLTTSYLASEFSENTKDSDKPLEELGQDERYPLDLVLSDMYAPILPPVRYWNNTTNSAIDRMLNTSGIKVVDHEGSINLCDAALILAIDLLKPNGSFVCKFYTGAKDMGLEGRLKSVFKKVHRFKPSACRPESKECYFVCLDKRKNVDKVEVFTKILEARND